jgi:hypothetical protein
LPFFKQRRRALSYVLGGWKVAGVTVFQSGHRLSVLNSNAFNAYGISGFGQDFAQVGSCSPSQVNTPGAVTSKLSTYINQNCFYTDYGTPSAAPIQPQVIGDDGLATGFGNTRPGLVRGPDQRNTDLSVIKQFGIRWPSETANVEFRAEFFNAFNTPQFADPDLEQDSATFGQVLSTSVAPRIMQFALKLNF